MQTVGLKNIASVLCLRLSKRLYCQIYPSLIRIKRVCLWQDGEYLPRASVDPQPDSSALSFSGQAVTFTAHIRVTPPGAGVPTGMVTFMDGTRLLAPGVTVVQGQATYSTNSMAVGNHAITASYSGDNSFLPSNSNVYGESVKKALTTAAAVINTRSALSPSAVDALFASDSNDTSLVALPGARRNAHQRPLLGTVGSGRNIRSGRKTGR